MLGTSYHADFVNGWKPEVLAAAMKDCGHVGQDVDKCPAFQAGGTADTTKNNCRLQGMIPDEENGYLQPLKYLPGCNPEWPADAGDAKPTDCPWRKPTPGFTPPNAFWSESTLEQTMPLAVEMDPKAETDFSQFTNVVGNLGRLSPWGENFGTGRFFQFLNKDAVMVGTAQDVADNLNMDTAVFKTSQVRGMQDSSAWRGMQPASVVGPEAHKILKVPEGVATALANGGGIPTAGPDAPAADPTPTAAANASNAEPTPNAPAPNAGNGTEQPPAEQAPGEGAGSSNASGSSAAGTPAASPSAASPEKAPAVELPGGANNLVAHEEGAEISSAAPISSSTVPAAQPTPSTGGSKTPGVGGHKKCTRRRRRSGSRLH